MERFSRLTRSMMLAGIAVAVLLLAPVVSSPAWADHFYTAYYDLASATHVTESGYGGTVAAPVSGGAGDSLVRIVNPTHDDTIQDGTICAMLYIFDDAEEMQACCGCPVTPDGLRTISVMNQLTTNWGINRGNLTAGVIDLVPSSLNWRSPFAEAPPPRGVNQTAAADCANGPCGCDPSGGGLRVSGGNNSTAVTGEGELKAWLNHTEQMYPASGATFITSTSVTAFAGAYLDSTHQFDLESSCGALLTGDSGEGICSCGVGDSHSLFRPKK